MLPSEEERKEWSGCCSLATRSAAQGEKKLRYTRQVYVNINTAHPDIHTRVLTSSRSESGMFVCPKRFGNAAEKAA